MWVFNLFIYINILCLYCFCHGLWDDGLEGRRDDMTLGVLLGQNETNRIWKVIRPQGIKTEGLKQGGT